MERPDFHEMNDIATVLSPLYFDSSLFLLRTLPREELGEGLFENNAPHLNYRFSLFLPIFFK